MDNFPDEIVFSKILVELKGKPLIQLKEVCKSWCAGTGDKSFIDGHRICWQEKNRPNLIAFAERGTKKFILVLCVSRKRVRRIRVPPNYATVILQIVDFSNGLVCMRLWWEEVTRLALYNPVTRQVRRLPIPLVYSPEFEKLHVALGFRLNVTTNEYKVVRLCVDKKSHPFVCMQVFDKGGIAWRNVSAPLRVQYHYHRDGRCRKWPWLTGFLIAPFGF